VPRPAGGLLYRTAAGLLPGRARAGRFMITWPGPGDWRIHVIMSRALSPIRPGSAGAAHPTYGHPSQA
jgi:hypothetical protein